MLRPMNNAGLFQGMSCFVVHDTSILTPRLLFKDQFRHPDECHGLNYTGFAKTLSSKGSLQNLPPKGEALSHAACNMNTGLGVSTTKPVISSFALPLAYSATTTPFGSM